MGQGQTSPPRAPSYRTPYNILSTGVCLSRTRRSCSLKPELAKGSHAVDKSCRWHCVRLADNGNEHAIHIRPFSAVVRHSLSCTVVHFFAPNVDCDARAAQPCSLGAAGSRERRLPGPAAASSPIRGRRHKLCAAHVAQRLARLPLSHSQGGRHNALKVSVRGLCLLIRSCLSKSAHISASTMRRLALLFQSKRLLPMCTRPARSLHLLRIRRCVRV